MLEQRRREATIRITAPIRSPGVLFPLPFKTTIYTEIKRSLSYRWSCALTSRAGTLYVLTRALLGFSTLALPVSGQDDPPPITIPKEEPESNEVSDLEEFVVTGSRIKTIDLESVAPVLTMERSQIKASGATQITDLIRKMPVTSGAAESGQPRSFAGDGGQANLRGTGVGGTLVLVNGRRMVPYAFSTGGGDNFVDLNAIPIGAIERIEVLKNGGSAIYGSDALAGVINFILRKDYEGGEVHTFYETTTGGDNIATWGADLTWGKVTDRSNLMVMANYSRRDQLMMRDRSFSASPDHTDEGGFDLRGWDTYPGLFDFTTLRPVPTNPFATEDHLYIFWGDGLPDTFNEFERYNINTETTAVSGAERVGMALLGGYALSDSLEFFTEFSYQDNASHYQSAPAPLDRDIIIPKTNPFNPTESFNNFSFGPLVPRGGLDVTEALLRPTDTGPRETEISSRSLRLVTGLNGKRGRSGEWEFSYLYGRSEVDDLTRNLIRADLFQDALNGIGDDALNPFASGPGEDNNAAIYSRLTTDDLRAGERQVHQVNFGISSDLFETKAGGASGHFGFEFRAESMARVQSELAENLLLFGSGGTSAKGSRNLTAVYGELVVPITGRLESHLAVRWENYSDFGSTITPKLGLKFRFLESLLLRASYSEGFKAPSLEQAFGGVTRGFIQERDFLRTNFTFDVYAENTPWPWDDFRSREVRTTGNPDLEPEESIHYNIGVVFNPKSIPDLTVGFDFWRLEIDNAIGQQSILSLLAAEEDLYFEDPVNFLFNQDPETRGELTGIFRQPNGPWVFPDTPGLTFTIPGKIEYVVSEYNNFEGVALTGLDLEVFYHHPTETMGDLWIRHYSVYIDRYINSGVNLVGFVGIPQYQAYNTIQWLSANRNLQCVVTAVYTSGYGTEFLNVPEVPGNLTWDLQVTYSGIHKTEISVGVKNLFDHDPPSNFTRPEGYDASVGAFDPYGRIVSLSVKRSF